ncbi:putative methyltransferase [Arthrobacter globiformis NBRC 12137]|uniref:Putative methyltransferase n=1 Tax=Arthrobacter globiformis (strain ATCC 8010 / DSM 20124 / JCM 1332 / NBRC 12137 / NCIMB 8907 / NRRL B-2979 / 168) TaxID=1077972 RepID=H0QNY3_ARTG1|nr:class I SAM-dependent methyltransferase [Arthrobacter globiformis]GAB14534.1 putative methyltransferase [Arthrobacter globiformis NBRC 12137]
MDHEGHDGAARHWDEMYRSRPRVWSGRPNPQLVAEAAGLEPGTALDLGCGEGADALWLAEQGWAVTAVDVSAVALERAEQHAAGSAAGSRITWLQRDLDAWAPTEQFDLVSAQFLHSTEAPWQRPHRVAADAVRPGGTLLIVGHHPEGLPPWRSQPDESQSGEDSRPEESHTGEHSHSHGGDAHANSGMFFTAEQAADELGIAPPQWRVDVAASREREATGPDGQSAVLADAVLRATRLQPPLA